MSQLETVYGIHAVEALLRFHPRRVKQLWIAEGRREPRVEALLELAAGQRLAVETKPRALLDELASEI